jgi:TRAP-type C4-dicarboxylate transport system substrate-binding protein
MSTRQFWRTAAVGSAVGALVLTGCSGVNGGDSAGSGDGSIPSTRLQLATFVGPQTPYGAAIETFVDEVSEISDGAVEIEVFWEGSLLNGPDVLTGVADGRSDLGFSNANYSPAELPLSQLISVPFLSSDVVATQDAFAELYETNPDYTNEWSSLGVRPLAFQSVTPMVMLGETVPEDVDWLSGKTVRATSVMGNAVQAAGGNAVALALNELYESAQRGLIEGAASLNFGTIPSISLEEVMPHVADPGTGIYSQTTLIVNESTYEGLDESVRAVLDEASAGFNGAYLEQLAIFDAETCEVVLDAGGSVTRWDEEQTAEWQDLLGDSIVETWKEAASASGADVDAFYDEYLALIDQPADSDYVDGVAACAD